MAVVSFWCLWEGVERNVELTWLWHVDGAKVIRVCLSIRRDNYVGDRTCVVYQTSNRKLLGKDDVTIMNQTNS